MHSQLPIVQTRWRISSAKIEPTTSSDATRYEWERLLLSETTHCSVIDWTALAPFPGHMGFEPAREVLLDKAHLSVLHIEQKAALKPAIIKYQRAVCEVHGKR